MAQTRDRTVGTGQKFIQNIDSSWHSTEREGEQFTQNLDRAVVTEQRERESSSHRI